MVQYRYINSCRCLAKISKFRSGRWNEGNTKGILSEDGGETVLINECAGVTHVTGYYWIGKSPWDIWKRIAVSRRYLSTASDTPSEKRCVTDRWFRYGVVPAWSYMFSILDVRKVGVDWVERQRDMHFEKAIELVMKAWNALTRTAALDWKQADL